MGRLVACSPRIAADTPTDTHRPIAVTLATHVCRGLMSYGTPQLVFSRSTRAGSMKLLG
jgi:hypothetical protein